MCEKVISLVIELILVAPATSLYMLGQQIGSLHNDVIKDMREEKVWSIRYMDGEINETEVIFEKCRTELEKDETMKNCEGSYFEAICGNDQLRECMGEL